MLHLLEETSANARLPHLIHNLDRLNRAWIAEVGTNVYRRDVEARLCFRRHFGFIGELKIFLRVRGLNWRDMYN